MYVTAYSGHNAQKKISDDSGPRGSLFLCSNTWYCTQAIPYIVKGNPNENVNVRRFRFRFRIYTALCPTREVILCFFIFIFQKLKVSDADSCVL